MKTSNKTLSYVLITPARNEEAFIEKTIRSVISQSILPAKWVIVSDGSSDRTDEIVAKYLSTHSWIELVRMPEHRDRQFAAKVHCFNAGYKKLSAIHYDIIGNLDADISFEENYLEFLLEKFSKIAELGVAGTPFIEDSYSSISDSFEGENHVAGGCQLFRRECFEEVGGYIPIKGGGIDWIAVTTARMKGWKTASFKEKHFFHHRRLGTGESNSIAANFSYGKKDYFLGGHPLWELFRIIYRMRKSFFGGLVIMTGYLCGMLVIKERPVSHELMTFHRQEQMKKLKLILSKTIKLEKINSFNLDS